MAELNDKLITYGNLSTFYDKLQEQGLGGNAIEDASVLPDAVENKNKLIRLESDKSVYISKYGEIEVPITPTNRLPDDEQISWAGFLSDEGNGGFVYRGEYIITCADGELHWYRYGDDLEFFICTEDDAEHTTSTTKCLAIETYESVWSNVSDSGITTTYTKSEFKSSSYPITGLDFEFAPMTYKATEDKQIGNAYMSVGNTTYFYTGEQVTIEYNSKQVTGYKWVETDETTLTPQPSNFIITEGTKAENLAYYYNDITGYGKALCNVYSSINGTIGSIQLETDIETINKNAPDSEQVGEAYIRIFNGGLVSDFYYTGELATINGQSGYKWELSNHNDFIITVGVKAEELYTNMFRVANGEITILRNSTSSEVAYEYVRLNLVQYKRSTEPGFGYLWKPVVTEDEIEDLLPLTDNATNDDIDFMFVKEIKLIRAQEDDENYIDWLVNTSGETMEFNGQTYYKWVVWGNDFNDGSGPAVEHPNLLVLTNALNVQLPFNSDSPEFEYRISTDGEEMESQDYIHGDYTQKTVQ